MNEGPLAALMVTIEDNGTMSPAAVRTYKVLTEPGVVRSLPSASAVTR
jgi:hypothetical protein